GFSWLTQPLATFPVVPALSRFATLSLSLQMLPMKLRATVLLLIVVAARTASIAGDSGEEPDEPVTTDPPTTTTEEVDGPRMSECPARIGSLFISCSPSTYFIQEISSFFQFVPVFYFPRVYEVLRKN